MVDADSEGPDQRSHCQIMDVDAINDIYQWAANTLIKLLECLN